MESTTLTLPMKKMKLSEVKQLGQAPQYLVSDRAER